VNPVIIRLSSTRNRFPAPTNLLTEGGYYSTDWRWLNKVAYSFTVAGIHKFTAFAGYEARQYAERSYYGTTGNIGFPVVKYYLPE
jgi:hypothetical protein